MLSAKNYRLISLTSVTCKLLERCVRDFLVKHLIKNKFIAKEQHGFVPKKSCVKNFLETADAISYSLANKKSLDMLLLDFAKAFNKVDQILSLHKVKAYGVAGSLFNWCSSFFTNRRQRVVLDDITSNWVEVTSGVPQGSVIGPSFFVLFINDLPEIFQSSRCKIFEDDTKIISELNIDGTSNLQNEIDKVIDWTQNWRIEL